MGLAILPTVCKHFQVQNLIFILHSNVAIMGLLDLERYYVTILRKNGLIAGLAKIDFFPEMASTKLRFCLSKILALYKAVLSRYDSK